MSKFWNQVQWNLNKKTTTEFRESSLLKLNCDKALHDLGWKPVWSFEETVKETALWYKNFYNNTNESTYNFTISQIRSYMKRASEKGILWAK
jgi:CDP-glucose 4,6-dehydratase